MKGAALDGFVVGVTADRRADEQIELLRRHGARTVHGPTLRTLPLVADAELRAATEALVRRRPDIVIANTGIGMRAWLSAAESWGMGDALADALRSAAVVARGPKAAGSLVTIGCDVSWRGRTGRLGEVVDHLLARDLRGVRIAYQRDGAEADAAGPMLRDAGAEVAEVVTYKWLRPEDESAALRLLDACCDRSVDAVTFTSPPAIENLFALAREHGRVDALRHACRTAVVPVCVGPVTREEAIAQGLDTAVASPRWALGAMVNTVVDALAAKRHHVALGDVQLELAGTVAVVDGRRLELTGREAAVLASLAARPGAVVSKSVLLRSVWGDASADPHALEMVVSRLRKQLSGTGAQVTTVVRRGYRLGG